MGYLKKAVVGFGWMSLLKVYMKALTLFRIILIARILSPHDLGLFGLATVVLSLVEVMTDTGINTFLIAIRKDFNEYINTAWVIAIVRGGMIGLIVISAAFMLSRFYNEPELMPLLLIAALIPSIKGFINPSLIRFHKEMRYHSLAIFRAVIFTSEIAVSLILAITMQSAYALMIAMVFSGAFETVLTHVFLTPRPIFRATWERVQTILHYGKWLNLSGLFSFLGNNADDLVVGKILGTTSLGYYQTGFNVSQSLAGEVGDLASQTLFPVYAAMHTRIRELRRTFFMAFVPLAIILTIPIAMVLAFPHFFVSLILGDTWLPIIPLLPWLFGAGYLQALDGVIYPIYMAVEKPQYSTIVVLINTILMLILIIPLSNTFGLVGVGMAVFISKLIVQPIYAYYAYTILKKHAA